MNDSFLLHNELIFFIVIIEFSLPFCLFLIQTRNPKHQHFLRLSCFWSTFFILKLSMTNETYVLMFVWICHFVYIICTNTKSIDASQRGHVIIAFILFFSSTCQILVRKHFLEKMWSIIWLLLYKISN